MGVNHSGFDICVPVCLKQVEEEVVLMIGNLVSYFIFFLVRFYVVVLSFKLPTRFGSYKK
jgi:hypothetical protein